MTATRIGRYYLLEEVGRGGLGIVYAAFDPQLGRRVALKVVRPDREDSNGGYQQRLLQEARALARLTHPNVVAVHDAGIHDESVFVAMELVVGETLTHWVHRRDPDWREIRDILVQAGRGLDAAHRAGVVHRDFKPANVLVDDDGRVRVVDFGLAHTVVAEAALHNVVEVADKLATHGGTLMGTPVYMAPEQFDGHTSAASDQWGFCATAYEMFYGHPPFSARSLADLMSMIRAGSVPDPADPRGVPGWMLRVLLRGLRVDPTQRHACIADLLTAMHADRTRRRRRVGIATTLTLTLGLAVASARAFGTSSDPDLATLAMFEQQAREAAHIGAFIYPAIDDLSRPTAYASVLALEAQGSEHPDALARASLLRTEFADALVAVGDTYWATDGGRGFASDFYAAALLFDPKRTDLRERTAITLGELAELRRRASAGRFTEAELQGAAVLSALAESDPTRRTVRLKSLATEGAPLPIGVRADVDRVLGHGHTRRASKSTSDSFPPDTGVPSTASAPNTVAVMTSTVTASHDPLVARQAVGQGRSHLMAGEFAAAETAFHRALDADALNHAALSGLFEVYFNGAAYQKALSFAQRAVSIAPRRAEYRMQLGDAYLKVLRYDDARREYEVALRRGHRGAKAALARLQARLGKAG